jgi:hypothetical protein
MSLIPELPKQHKIQVSTSETRCVRDQAVPFVQLFRRFGMSQPVSDVGQRMGGINQLMLTRVFDQLAVAFKGPPNTRRLEKAANFATGLSVMLVELGA